MYPHTQNPMTQEEPIIRPRSSSLLEIGIPHTASSQISEISTFQNASQHPVSQAQVQHEPQMHFNSGSSSLSDNRLEQYIHQHTLNFDEDESMQRMPPLPSDQLKIGIPQTASSQISESSTFQNDSYLFDLIAQDQQRPLTHSYHGSSRFRNNYMDQQQDTTYHTQQTHHQLYYEAPACDAVGNITCPPPRAWSTTTSDYNRFINNCQLPQYPDTNYFPPIFNDPKIPTHLQASRYSNQGSTYFPPVPSYEGQAALQYSQPILYQSITQFNSYNQGTYFMDMQPVCQSSNQYVPQHHDYLEQPSTSGTNTRKSSRKRDADSVLKETEKRVCQVKGSPALPPTNELRKALIGLVRRMEPKDVEPWTMTPVPGWKGECVDGSSAIQLYLNADQLWSGCHSLNTEMVTTTVGRRIFPGLSVSVTGLEPEENYIFFLDVVLANPNLAKYQNGEWTANGQAEEYPPRNKTLPLIYIPEYSPKSGREWMESGVNFTHLKITNNKEIAQTENMIFLYSMHQFIPRYHVARQRLVEETSGVNAGVQTEGYDFIGSYIIPGTQFYTVTAYQNSEIVTFKINNNPFAKGFRNKVEDC